MAFILTKLFVTAGLIVLITEIAKRSDKFGGMLAAFDRRYRRLAVRDAECKTAHEAGAALAGAST